MLILTVPPRQGVLICASGSIIPGPGYAMMNLASDSLLEFLFDHMPLGAAVFDADLRLQRYNPAWADFLACYAPSSSTQIQPGSAFFDLTPDSEAEMRPILERVLAGETVRLDGLRRENEGDVSWWDVLFLPLLADGRIVGLAEI
ncbi:MAG TPA: PAS domain-containing protein, partial [Anaerolineae bacterium]|nr:PAS domain-containing protein [Anaerolineae bacterium]